MSVKCSLTPAGSLHLSSPLTWLIMLYSCGVREQPPHFWYGMWSSEVKTLHAHLRMALSRLRDRAAHSSGRKGSLFGYSDQGNCKMTAKSPGNSCFWHEVQHMKEHFCRNCFSAFSIGHWPQASMARSRPLVTKPEGTLQAYIHQTRGDVVSISSTNICTSLLCACRE